MARHQEINTHFDDIYLFCGNIWTRFKEILAISTKEKFEAIEPKCYRTIIRMLWINIDISQVVNIKDSKLKKTHSTVVILNAIFARRGQTWKHNEVVYLWLWMSLHTADKLELWRSLDCSRSKVKTKGGTLFLFGFLKFFLFKSSFSASNKQLHFT